MTTKGDKHQAWLDAVSMAKEKKKLQGPAEDPSPKTATRLEMINRMQEGVCAPLKASLIDPSRFANRIEASFQNKAFLNLKAMIKEKGGNVQPIKVRPKMGGRYEVVYGHRRLQACKELDLDVLAIIQSMDDLSLWRDMTDENRGRKDLSPYEQAVHYQLALNEGLFEHWTEVAKALGHKSHTPILRYKALANLPREIINAFQSPLEIALRDAQLLARALEKNPEGMIDKANILALSKPNKATVLKELLNLGESIVSTETWPGGSIRYSATKTVIEIHKELVSEAQIEQLIGFAKKLIQ